MWSKENLEKLKHQHDDVVDILETMMSNSGVTNAKIYNINYENKPRAEVFYYEDDYKFKLEFVFETEFIDGGFDCSCIKNSALRFGDRVKDAIIRHNEYLQHDVKFDLINDIKDILWDLNIDQLKRVLDYLRKIND